MISLWGTLCHHAESGVSRFIPCMRPGLLGYTLNRGFLFVDEPVYGPAAREEARRFMREAKREKIHLGWPTKTSLCKVAKGERPLAYPL